MVGHPGRTPDTRRIRRLKSPRAVEVEAAADGTPLRLRLGNAWTDVHLTRRPWRIDQHWWRGTPLRRDYYEVAPEDGQPVTVYRDEVTGEWARQAY
jgi:hypothetical protein